MCRVDFAGGVLGPLGCLARLPQGCIISTFKFRLIQFVEGGRGRQYYRIVALIYVNRYYKKVFTYSLPSINVDPRECIKVNIYRGVNN
jgi:hypothetical protein